MNEDELQTPTPPPQQGPSPPPQNRTSNKKQILIALLAGILIIGAGAYVIAKRSNNKANKVDIYARDNESRKEEEATKPLTEEEKFLVGAKNSAEVKVTQSGFKPMVITIKPDTKVTWTTDDTNVYGIAANPGSKVTKYFGSKKDIDLHTLYAARFTDEGTYTYHDTKNPTNNGTIIVTK